MMSKFFGAVSPPLVISAALGDLGDVQAGVHGVHRSGPREDACVGREGMVHMRVSAGHLPIWTCINARG
jgi:hypothetical protein